MGTALESAANADGLSTASDSNSREWTLEPPELTESRTALEWWRKRVRSRQTICNVALAGQDALLIDKANADLEDARQGELKMRMSVLSQHHDFICSKLPRLWQLAREARISGDHIEISISTERLRGAILDCEYLRLKLKQLRGLTYEKRREDCQQPAGETDTDRVGANGPEAGKCTAQSATSGEREEGGDVGLQESDRPAYS